MAKWIAGVDGCHEGWFRVSRKIGTGELKFAVCGSASELLVRDPAPSVLCIDIPIGLPERGDRGCDKRARELLGWPRRASVFPAPLRRSLSARSHPEASRISKAADGRKISAQTWALIPKIKEVDTLVRHSGNRQGVIFEVHPEVSFWAWAGQVPMQHRKKTKLGRAERNELVAAWLGADFLMTARSGYLKKHVADDDILDATAALWTALRIHQSKAEYLKGFPSRDASGVQMRITY